MDVLTYSKRCIRKYLEKYNIILEVREKNVEKTNLINGKMIISTRNDPKFGIFKYEFNETYLFINKIRIKKNKHNVPIKLLKIFLLYLLSMYNDKTEYVMLMADPYAFDNVMGIGTELCLSCYYQKLGFEPENVDLTNYIEKCLRVMDPSYKKLQSLCLLCECQKHIKSKKIKINDFGNFTNLKVSMKALLPNLRKALKDSYDEIRKSV
jgi:hypothetical protein